ncbi:MAG: xylulokinase [bacterium]
MADDLALGVDIGTGGARALLIDAAGTILGRGESSYPLLAPRPGLAEQRPEDWWTSACTAIEAAISDVRAERIAGIGFAGQMHGAVLVDERLQPLRTALLWCDGRAADAAGRITAERGAGWLIAQAGNPPLSGFTAPQLRFLSEQGDPALKRARWVLCAKDFVRLMMTGVPLAEPSDASGTGLYSIIERDWGADLAEAYGVDARMLPPIVGSGEGAGSVTAAAAKATGLVQGTPVAAGAADNAAAALGSGVTSAGQLMVSVGTSGTVLAPTGGEPDPSGRCHLFRHATGDGWYSMAVVLSAGGALSWWQGVAGADLEILAEEAERAPAGSDGVVMLPYLSGRRMPSNEPGARGSFVGLSLSHGRAELTRAVLEGAGFALADGLFSLREIGVTAKRAVITGAASAHRIWQEILGLAMPDLRLERALPAEGAALGAALLGFQVAGRPLEPLLEGMLTFEPVPAADVPESGRDAVAAARRQFQALSHDPLLTGRGEANAKETR